MPKRTLNQAGISSPANNKRARYELFAGQKREVCQYKLDHTKAMQQEIAAHFSSLFEVTIGRSTISDVLAKKDKWLQIDEDSENDFLQQQ